MTAGRYVCPHEHARPRNPAKTPLYRTEYYFGQNKRNSMPAPQYIDFVFTSIHNTLEDESVFPTKAGRLVVYVIQFV